MITNQDSYDNYNKTEHLLSRLPARDDEPVQNVRLEDTKFEECLQMLLSNECTNHGVQDVVIIAFKHASFEAHMVAPDNYVSLPCSQ